MASIIRQLRNYFFTQTAPLGTPGWRFRKGDEPTEETFEELFDSIAFMTEKDDTATDGLQGLVQLADDTAARTRVNTPDANGFAKVLRPSQRTGGANVGTGDAEVFKGDSVAGFNLEFRELKGINGAGVAENGDLIEIDGHSMEGPSWATFTPISGDFTPDAGTLTYNAGDIKYKIRNKELTITGFVQFTMTSAGATNIDLDLSSLTGMANIDGQQISVALATLGVANTDNICYINAPTGTQKIVISTNILGSAGGLFSTVNVPAKVFFNMVIKLV